MQSWPTTQERQIDLRVGDDAATSLQTHEGTVEFTRHAAEGVVYEILGSGYERVDVLVEWGALLLILSGGVLIAFWIVRRFVVHLVAAVAANEREAVDDHLWGIWGDVSSSDDPASAMANLGPDELAFVRRVAAQQTALADDDDWRAQYARVHAAASSLARVSA